MLFAPYLSRWKLSPDGEAIHTRSSDLLPVRWHGQAAMLKLARSDEERVGNGLMAWWNGEGAARVFGQDGAAILLERLESGLSLTDLVHAGQDDEASRMLCGVIARLHEPRDEPLPELVPLERWFRALEPAAEKYGGVLAKSAEAARILLAQPQEVIPLHGDIHHENVLHSRRGWLAIDPKGLIGERTFEYANILCNPDLKTAAQPGRLARQAQVIAGAARLDRTRLLQWVLAYAGLSAAWHLEDGQEEQARQTLAVAALAAAELGLN
jgi:streptomycin 6-kinase